jgi:hypothetical protein
MDRFPRSGVLERGRLVNALTDGHYPRGTTGVPLNTKHLFLISRELGINLT